MMCFVRIAHIVRHNINKVEIWETFLKVDKLGSTDGGNGNKLVLAKFTTQLLDKQRKVVYIIGR